MKKRRAQSGGRLLLALGVVSLTVPAWGQGRVVVEDVRVSSLSEVTRVVVELSRETEIRRDRLSKPERLFFDFENSNAKRRGLWTIPVNDDLVKQIRVGASKPGTTRVVLDLKHTVTVEESELQNPYRHIFEMRKAGGEKPARPVEVSRSGAAGARGVAAPTSEAPAVRPVIRPVPRPETAKLGRRTFTLPEAMRPGLPELTNIPPPRLRAAALLPRPQLWLSAQSYPAWRAPVTPTPHPRPITKGDVVASAASAAPAKGSEQLSAAAAANAETANRASARVPALAPPSAVAAPGATPMGAANGGKSLTRALGLKIRRVVLDAGHGGHDQGSSGPTGLLEKELVLDVTMRLGKLIESAMGSEVVYTRQDDQFIPLEERTRIANASKADLFLSIHANSSAIRSVSGVETYYLSLTNSRDAMEIAARENASSDRSVFELRDLLQKIATQDKVEESREFAAKVNSSLYKVWGTPGAPARNRGVKKAPFIVLIGASMPSVLAEIGFLSNGRDEKELKKPEVRQKIAEALLKGITQYSDSLSHFAAGGGEVPRRAEKESSEAVTATQADGEVAKEKRGSGRDRVVASRGNGGSGK